MLTKLLEIENASSQTPIMQKNIKYIVSFSQILQLENFDTAKQTLKGYWNIANSFHLSC